MSLKNLKLLIGLLIFVSSFCHAAEALPFLSFEELERTSRKDFGEQESSSLLQNKLEKLFSSVDIQTKHTIPNPNSYPELGKTLNVVKGVLIDTSNYLSIATSALLPGSGFIINLARNGIDFIRNLLTPIVNHIPILSENPSHKLFKQLKDFQFDDGHVFDLRGSKWRSYGKGAILSNTNERRPIGFHSTFKTPKTFLVFGREPYRMAPLFGEVLDNFNESMSERYSDHHPMFVTLPFEEPVELNQREAKEYKEELLKRQKERFNQGSDYFKDRRHHGFIK